MLQVSEVTNVSVEVRKRAPGSVKRSWFWNLHISFGPNFSPSKLSSDHCISVPSKHVTFDLFLLEMLLFSAPQLLLI